jgi:hypothetical protein
VPKLAIGRIVHYTQYGPGFRGELVVPAIVTETEGDRAWLTVFAPNQPPYTQGSVSPGKAFSDAGTWHWPAAVLEAEESARAESTATGTAPNSDSALSPAAENELDPR